MTMEPPQPPVPPTNLPAAGPTSPPSPAQDIAVSMREIRAAYGSIEVVHGIDLEVERGAVYALLGSNGGGKTTLMNVLAGLHAPTAGTITVDGADITNMPAHRRSKTGLCMIPEGRGIFPNLTVRENLFMVTNLGVSMAAVEAKAYELFPVLDRKRSQLAGSMSGGEQQMLSLARAFATDPKVLILDELSMGLAPLIVSQLYEQVASFVGDGRTIIVVEQFARAVLPISTKASIVAHGVIVETGTPDEIEAALSSSYLG